MHFILGHSYNLITSNLARLAGFDGAVDADLTGIDHCFGSAPRGRKPKQFEEDVHLVELESMLSHRHAPSVSMAPCRQSDPHYTRDLAGSGRSFAPASRKSRVR